MSCSPFDVRDYVLEELSEEERRAVEAHALACASCREELDRLRVTHAAMLTFRDEEIPQRIAFVSDKVFEPSSFRRFWSAFWTSSARLAFAASAMLLVAAVVWRPPARVAPPAPAVDMARLQAEFEARFEDAIAKAVTASEARQEKRTAEILQSAARRYEMDRSALLAAADENFRMMRMREGSMVLASSGSAGAGR
jgi:hypothetical protein